MALTSPTLKVKAIDPELLAQARGESEIATKRPLARVLREEVASRTPRDPRREEE